MKAFFLKTCKAPLYAKRRAHRPACPQENNETVRCCGRIVRYGIGESKNMAKVCEYVRILLVEDDASIVATLGELLRSEGYAVISCARQDDACALLAAQQFDLALLDIALAQGSGFAVCAAARATAPAMPVIFLSASDDEFTTVAGLDMGAVDYIAKPFRARELVSRIKGALARANPAQANMRLQDISIDSARASVSKAGADVQLSALEYRLLLLFAQNAGKLITRDALRNAIWDSAGEYVSDNAINVYIKRLRERIESDPSEPRIIVTVRGLGYKAVP